MPSRNHVPLKSNYITKVPCFLAVSIEVRQSLLSLMSITVSLNDLLKNLYEQKKYTHICIVGDFNYGSINWANWTTSKSENSLEANFLETLRDCFLFQSASEPTRNCGTDEPSTLDLILTNEDNH